jgi:acetoin:2,6-dichlorophenolindophenol oxidoreductase subunit beta
MTEMTFSGAVQDALSVALASDPSVICYGLGVDDPKGVFGTTSGLQDVYGEDRVFDMPTSENAMTGIAVGAALGGMRPVMTHQRLDFFLLAMDQLVNSAAKWHYMFGGQSSVPITIRLIIGRGWGQGPTHAQSLQSWFAHIPGLKVVMPTFPDDAKGLLLSSIFDPDPVVFLEHRWLHNGAGSVPEGDVRTELGLARKVVEGDDLTIVSVSYMTVEALHAVETLRDFGVECELIDLRSIRPIDWDCIHRSVRRTGRLLALDTANPTCSVANEIVARVSANCFDALRSAPAIIALPDTPSPTSAALAGIYYPDSATVAVEAARLVGVDLPEERLNDLRRSPSDVPGDWFTGPF